MEILSNISPLPFYTSLSQQYHRQDYTFGQVYPLITKNKRILPFQFILDTASGTGGGDFDNDFNEDYSRGAESHFAISIVEVISLNSGGSFNITSAISGSLKSEDIASNIHLIKFAGNIDIEPLSQEGPYYIKINTTAGSLYSEVFMSVKDVSDYVALEYRNAYDLNTLNGPIDFTNNFTFRCYLDARVAKPEYIFEEEATSRMGSVFIESQVSKKAYKFTCIGPEYLCDALRLIRLCSSKRIITKYKTYEATSFSMDTDWEDQGDLATITCEFETDNILQNIGNIL